MQAKRRFAHCLCNSGGATGYLPGFFDTCWKGNYVQTELAESQQPGSHCGPALNQGSSTATVDGVQKSHKEKASMPQNAMLCTRKS